MKTRINCNIAILIIGFILYSCNSSSEMNEQKKDPGDKQQVTKPQVDYNLYFPASVGNKWEYTGETARCEPASFSVQIVSIKNSGKDVIVEFDKFPFFDKTNGDTKLKFKESGEIDVIYNDTTENVFIPQTKNLRTDYQWGFGMWQAYITSINDSVYIEQEKIENCVKLNYALSITMNAEIWIAKDKGIVRWGLNRTNPPTPIDLFQYYKLKNLTLSK